MKYLFAALVVIVPSCATFTLQSEDPRYGKVAVVYSLPEPKGFSK